MHRIPPQHLLACPTCQADVASGFAPAQQRCNNCNLDFFELNGLPCWFTSGLAQRDVWQNLFAQMVENGKKNLAESQQWNEQTLLPSTMARLQKRHQTDAAIFESMRSLLAESGLKSVKNPKYSDHSASHLLEYYELLLRDWAWNTSGENNTTLGDAPISRENHEAFLRIKNALDSCEHALGDTWVIGCGAGRLSADIHTQLNATSTIALDANLILITAAHRMAAQQKSWQLSEKNRFPQLGFDDAKTWQINALPYSATQLAHWYAIAGDAWAPPLKPASFDTIITPWFIDVNGKPPTALIGQVQKYLKPGGLWINSGPLLYSESLHESQGVHHEEILELLSLSGFTEIQHNSEVCAYLNSPLNTQQRFEQVWTFAAKAPQAQGKPTTPEKPQPSAPYPWVILPHLPIPQDTPLNTQGNPVLEQLAALADGTRSLNAIAEIMRPNLGEGKDPLSVVRSAFLEYLLK